MRVKQQSSPLSGMYRRYRCQATAIASEIFLAIDSPLSATALDLLRSGRFHELVSLKADPSAYRDSSSFRDDYLVSELMSKFPSWNIGIDRKKAALAAFEAAEVSCSEANLRLSRSYGTASTTVSYASYLYTARRKIARVLGPFDWDQAEQFFGFGPGASYSLKRKYGDAYHKFGCIPEVTKGCAALGYAAIRRVPGWLNHLTALCGSQEPLDILKIVEGNRITTVPKNAKTDRVIAIEPLMNMFIQKGIGGLIRKRLKRVGIDLDDQTPNQVLACEGSLTNMLATVDLSSASDTIALALVRELLPNDWYRAIEQARSEVGILPDGRKISYHKVSSMGNGFTFELESLIFWALSAAVIELHGESERRLKVYGDDIIIASSLFGHLSSLLTFAGFTVNKKKSFCDGPFRESCGKHFFNGSDVSPFYIRKDVTSTDRLLLTLNNVRRYSARGQVWGLDGRFLPVYNMFRNMLPGPLRRPLISDGYGDNALFGDFDEVLPKRAKWGIEGWEVHSFSFEKPTYLPMDTPVLLKALYSLERRQISNEMSPSRMYEASGRGEGSSASFLDVSINERAGKWRTISFVIPQWETKGPWL